MGSAGLAGFGMGGAPLGGEAGEGMEGGVSPLRTPRGSFTGLNSTSSGVISISRDSLALFAAYLRLGESSAAAFFSLSSLNIVSGSFTVM